MLGEIDYDLTVSSMILRAGGTINARKLTIKPTSLEAQEGSLIDLNYRGDIKSGLGYRNEKVKQLSPFDVHVRNWLIK